MTIEKKGFKLPITLSYTLDWIPELKNNFSSIWGTVTMER
jgi:hypothetical protein